MEDLERTETFRFGFEIGKRLAEPEFRDRLKKAGIPNGCVFIPAINETTMEHVVGCMDNYPSGLIVMPDKTQSAGVRLIWWEHR